MDVMIFFKDLQNDELSLFRFVVDGQRVERKA